MTYLLSRSSVRHGGADGGASFSAAASTQLRTAMTDAMSTGIDRLSTRSSGSWKPEGVLLAHYVEHRRRVNQIAVSDHSSNPFFVTASNDGSIKVWDLKHIDDDLSFRSCATYAAQKGEIYSVSLCEDHHSVASSSSLGSIHIWRVNYAPAYTTDVPSDRFSGISSRHDIDPSEGAILHVQQWDALLLYATQRGIIHAWDIRTKGDAWRLRLDPKEGYVCRLAVDPLNGGTWIVTGSSQGVLDVWDVRFQLRVAQWKHPSLHAIVDIAPANFGGEQMRAMGIKSQGPFVYVAAGGNEVGLWDVQDQTCKQASTGIPVHFWLSSLYIFPTRFL